MLLDHFKSGQKWPEMSSLALPKLSLNPLQNCDPIPSLKWGAFSIVLYSTLTSDFDRKTIFVILFSLYFRGKGINQAFLLM